MIIYHKITFCSYHHVSDTENGCNKKHRNNNTQNCHTILLLAHLCRNGDETKIAFHSRHLPKSVKAPSDTCNTRSAVCAMPRLWVIIMMVCSYFFDVSLSNAITSLLFCESRFPVSSSVNCTPIPYALKIEALTVCTLVYCVHFYSEKGRAFIPYLDLP